MGVYPHNRELELSRLERIEDDLEHLIGFSTTRPAFQRSLVSTALNQEVRRGYNPDKDPHKERWPRVRRMLQAGKPIIDLFEMGTKGTNRSTRPHKPYSVHVREASIAGLTNSAELLCERTELIFTLRYLLHLAHDGGEDHKDYHGVALTRDERIELYDNAVIEALDSAVPKLEKLIGASNLRVIIHEYNQKLTMGRRSETTKEPYASILGGLTRSGSMIGKVLSLDGKVADRFSQASEFEICDQKVLDVLDELLPQEYGIFDTLMTRFTEIPQQKRRSHDERMKAIAKITRGVTQYDNHLKEARRQAKSTINKTLPKGVSVKNREPWEWVGEMYKGQGLSFKIGHFIHNQFMPYLKEESLTETEIDIFGIFLLNAQAYHQERLKESIRLERLITLTGHRDSRVKPLSVFAKNKLFHEQAMAYMKTEASRRFQATSRSNSQGMYRFNNTFGRLHKVEANINGARKDYAKKIEDQLADIIVLQQYMVEDILAFQSFIPAWFAYRAGEIETPPSAASLQIMKEDFPTRVNEWDRK